MQDMIINGDFFFFLLEKRRIIHIALNIDVELVEKKGMKTKESSDYS